MGHDSFDFDAGLTRILSAVDDALVLIKTSWAVAVGGHCPSIGYLVKQ